MKRLRALGAIALFAALAVAVLFIHDARSAPGKRFLTTTNDFTPFYCAGTLVRDGEDPYLTEPLRTCERRHDGFVAGEASWHVVPTPFPGYALALFAVLSLLPFAIAHAVWTFGIFAAVGAVAWASARIGGFPVALVAAAIVTQLGVLDVMFGEPTPFVAAFLALAAERASRRAWRSCGLLVVAAMIEPHVALPALIALVAFVPAARAAALAGAAVLGVVSIFTIGPAENVEYFLRALPAQAASEVHFSAQFSLTHLLALFGVSDRIALITGSASYVVMTVVGVWLGRRLSSSTGRREFLILIPSAVALIGGNFSHGTQVVTALGAAVAVASLRGVPRLLAFAPLLLLVPTWLNPFASWHGLALATAGSTIAAIILVVRRDPLPIARRAGLAVGLTVALAVAYAALQRIPGPLPMRAQAKPAVRFADDSIAGTVWAYRNALPPYSQLDRQAEANKVPPELGLFAILACAISVRRSTAKPPQPLLDTGPAAGV